MSKRKKNPSLGAVVALVAIAGVTLWGVTAAARKPTSSPKKVSPPPDTGGTKTPDKYVGSGWTNWPHKDFFLKESFFGETLQLLGYAIGVKDPATDPTWSARDPGVRAAVRDFQEDWNTVVAKAAGILKDHVGASVKVIKLQVDDKLGPKTIDALYEAFLLNEDKPWQDVVEDAKSA